MIKAIQDKSEQVLEQKLRESKFKEDEARKQLAIVEKKLRSVEEKWIVNQMSYETYQTWYDDLKKQCMSFQAQIDHSDSNPHCS